MKSYIQTPSLAGPSEFIEGAGEADRGGGFSAEPVYTNVGRSLPRQLNVEPKTLSELY